MKTPQLLGIVGAIAVAMACDHAERNATAEHTAAEVRTTAAKAREHLTDSWLTTKIQAQFFADDDVKARYIHVRARDGVVTLSGRVDSAAEHEQAVQIARNTDGVTRVDDQLQIVAGAAAATAVPSSGESVAASGSTVPAAPSATPAFDDARITAGVQSKFFVDDMVKARQIDVDTRQGVVTLQGRVASETERAQALLLARTSDGVIRVEDHLTVDAATGGTGAVAATGTQGSDLTQGTSGTTTGVNDDATLATTIQARFFLDGDVKAGAVEVSAKDGVVLLQGTVPSEAAHTQAVTIARTTDGVVQVVDRLQVTAPHRARRR